VRLEPGTRVLITGASRGIGAALAHRLAARGCVLGLVARGEDGLRELVVSLPGEGHRALPADVAERDSIAAAVAELGAVDVVVANAGVADYGPWLDLDPELEDRMTRINWLGTLYTVRAALPQMVERGSGHVVVVSSGAALRTFPGAAVYGATKAAQRGFAEGLWHDLDGTGVGVTIVYPGEIETNLHDHQPDKLPAWRKGGHEADVDECAAAIVEGIEKDRRGVYFPREVRLLQTVHGISPRIADLFLRRLRGPDAAPRRR
jgi:short-subunit dehydrogenase